MGRAENYVEGYLRDRCAEYDCICYKFTSPGTTGVPDEILINNGKIIFVETKSFVGRASATQKVRIAQMIAHGADVRICKTRKDIDDVLVELIDGYERKKHSAVRERNAKDRFDKVSKDDENTNKNIQPVVRKSIR